MKLHLIKPLLILFFGCVCLGGTAQAAPYAAGSVVEPFTVKNQHGESSEVAPKKLRFVLVSHDMETGKAANGVLSGLGKDYLPGKQAVFMANIEGMPGIGKMFALRKMKKYNHQILLGESAELIGKFPAQAGKVTVLKLRDGKVVEVRYWDPATDVAEVLK